MIHGRETEYHSSISWYKFPKKFQTFAIFLGKKILSGNKKGPDNNLRSSIGHRNIEPKSGTIYPCRGIAHQTPNKSESTWYYIRTAVPFWGRLYSELEWFVLKTGLQSRKGLLRGTIVKKTCGIHKNLYISPFLLTIFGPINYGPP